MRPESGAEFAYFHGGFAVRFRHFMDDEKTPETKPKLRLAVGSLGRKMRLEMLKTHFSKAEMQAQHADNLRRAAMSREKR